MVVMWLAISYIVLGYIIVPIIVVGVIYYTYAISNDIEVASKVLDIKNNATRQITTRNNQLIVGVSIISSTEKYMFVWHKQQQNAMIIPIANIISITLASQKRQNGDKQVKG